MKEISDDRVHARMALVRELFGLEVDEVATPSAAAEDEPQPLAEDEPQPLAEVRELRRR